MFQPAVGWPAVARPPRREQQGAVEILGLGVGLDLSPFYRRCLATDMTRGLDNELFFDIVQLFGGRHRR